ncbi:glycoside hydrolase family 2 TIM barrel-domain containing protein [Nonomuraea sp. 3N208]|uniref:glycoside hydrolase family 2 TIM barrel-domain containing protein n=1 Tax=Nonomuraea sp. 3N208 TaxID=3457421 RepID=UPI003FCFFA65
MRVRFGFRTVAIDESGVLTVNGRRVVLRGVNRHEFDPDRGRVVSKELMRRDVELMKQHNVNAVRTSHYPPHPAFLDLCDELEEWSQIQWFGAGPGEAYPDSRQAARIARFHATVDELQTPYVRPQDNGSRADVRWAEITDRAGAGIRIEGEPLFSLAARRWSDRHLAAARHQTDLVPEPLIYLYTDHVVHGVGSGAVGPGVLPQYRLDVRAADFAFILSTTA